MFAASLCTDVRVCARVRVNMHICMQCCMCVYIDRLGRGARGEPIRAEEVYASGVCREEALMMEAFFIVLSCKFTPCSCYIECDIIIRPS